MIPKLPFTGSDRSVKYLTAPEALHGFNILFYSTILTVPIVPPIRLVKRSDGVIKKSLVTRGWAVDLGIIWGWYSKIWNPCSCL